VSDDLETIPLDPSERPGSPLPSAPRWPRPSKAAATLGLIAAALVAGWLLFSGGSESSSRSGRKPGQGAALAGGEIVCPPGQGFAGTDLGRMGPSRESPEAAVADVTAAFREHPVAGYRYQHDEQGGDWVDFLGTAGTVPKARISVRHLEDGWVAVAIGACAGDYPAGVVDYPADRPVPPLSSTPGLLLVVNDPLLRRGSVATLALQDAAGHTIWELPPVGAWYPTPLSWSPDGRRFLFQVSAGGETATRVVILPDGRDVVVPGALTWIGDDALLVTRDGRLGRLDLPSGAVVAGPPLTQYVSSQAGTRDRAALVILPGATPGAGSGAEAQPPFVRIVDSALQTLDTVAPPGTVDCFSPAWTADGQRLDLVCRRSDPQAGSADIDVFEIDLRTLRWTRLPTGSVGSVEQPLRSPTSG
jgi:WD40 repeat protein